jgi:hypothetical protein
MIGALLGLCCLVASASEVPSTDPEPELITTEAMAPWGPGPELFVPPHALEGLTAYHRYQRLAHMGTPLFLGGVAMGAYGFWTVETQQDAAPNAIFVIAAGGTAAWAGAGMVAFGSVTAVQRLYGDDVSASRVAPGYVAYGLLGVSGVALMAGYYSTLVGLGPLALGFFAVALPFGIAGGVPALVQVVANPIHRRRWHKHYRQVRLVPMVEGKRKGARLAMRF